MRRDRVRTVGRSGYILDNKMVELPDNIADEICGMRGVTKGNAHMRVLNNWIDGPVFLPLFFNLRERGKHQFVTPLIYTSIG